MTNQELLDRIPRFKTGPHTGKIRNDRLKEIDSLLHKYKFTEQELKMLDDEIWHHTPKQKSNRD